MAHPTWFLRQHWSCCENLVFNKTTNVCADKSLIDERFKFCRSHSDCVGKLGCFSQHTSEFYTTESMDSVEVSYWKNIRDIFEQQQATLKRHEQKIGEFCYRHMECQSYKCEKFKCSRDNLQPLA